VTEHRDNRTEHRDKRTEHRDDLAEAVATFAANAVVVVALDFDGTLANLADDPQAVAPVPTATTALHALAADDGVVLALVSGRPASELARLASPPPGTALVGSHGAETGHVTGPGVAVLDDAVLTADERALHERLADTLSGIAEGRAGVWVEHKPVGLALHTRLAHADDAAAATQEALAGPAAWPGTHALHGKAVVEISVRRVSKGEALTRLRDAVAQETREPVPVFYAGDDVTDERAFAALRPGDVAVKVGAGETLATFRVSDPEALAVVLHDLASARAGG
jgi:trehalose 6-phosphate phosphatase